MYYILDVFSHLPRFFASCFYTCTREIFCLHSGGVNYLITGWSFSRCYGLGGHLSTITNPNTMIPGIARRHGMVWVVELQKAMEKGI
jgi:hypothetical protein